MHKHFFPPVYHQILVSFVIFFFSHPIHTKKKNIQYTISNFGENRWKNALKTTLGLASIISDLMPRALCIVIARKLHSELVNGIMHAPLSFYDRTPTGRILARFSKDIDVIDTDLPEALILTMYCSSEVIFIIFVCFCELFSYGQF